MDPLVPQGGAEQVAVWGELDEIASRNDRPIAILITIFWHERSAGELFERYGKTLGARVYAHREAVPRLDVVVTDPFEPGAELPGGVQAFGVERDGEVVFWVEGPRALIVGDVLLGREDGLRMFPRSWSGDWEASRTAVRGLLHLDPELVLTSHGPPVMSDGRTALARALI